MLIADAPWHGQRSGMALEEFATNPMTTGTLRRALKQDVAGSVGIALFLARKGHQDVLPDALARALRVADLPASGRTETQDAGSLLG